MSARHPPSVGGGVSDQGNTQRPVATACAGSMSQKLKGTRQPKFFTGSQIAGGVAGWQLIPASEPPVPSLPPASPPAPLSLPVLPPVAPVAPLVPPTPSVPLAPFVPAVPLAPFIPSVPPLPPVSPLPPVFMEPPVPWLPEAALGGSAYGSAGDVPKRQLATTSARPTRRKEGITAAPRAKSEQPAPRSLADGALARTDPARLGDRP